LFIEYFSMSLEEEIKAIAEGKLTDSRQFIVEVVISARKGPKKVLVIVDGDEGVNIDDCAAISREISKVLDESSSFLDEAYTLEVSTPGLDQPLKLKRQYVKNIGRKLKIKLPDKIEEGRLEAVSEDAITLRTETGSGKNKETNSIDINFAQIEKAFVLVSFK
jgi:ribosome maturation factor RimP